MTIVSNDNALVLQLSKTGTTASGKITFAEGLTKAEHKNVLPAVRHAVLEGKAVYIRLRAASESNTQLMCYPVIGVSGNTINFVALGSSALLLGVVT